MNLFSSFGGKVRGLLGGELFTDRLAQAQAFANGDYDSAARIGATMRDWRQLHPKASAVPAPPAQMSMPAPIAPPLGSGFNPHHGEYWFDRAGMPQLGRFGRLDS